MDCFEESLQAYNPWKDAYGIEENEPALMDIKEEAVSEEKKEDLETAAEAKKAESSNNKQNSSGSKKNKDLKKVRKTINAIIEKFSDEEGWLSSGQLGDQLGKRLPDFDVRNYGYSKLTPFIKSLGSYETGRIPTGSGGRKQIYFRMKEER